MKIMRERKKLLLTSNFSFSPQCFSFYHIDKLPSIFSSAVFGENPRYCYSLGVILLVQKTSTFCNISVIEVYVHYSKSNLYYRGRQLKMFFFFYRFMPVFRLRPLSSFKHPTAEHFHPYAVLLLITTSDIVVCELFEVVKLRQSKICRLTMVKCPNN